MDEFDPKYAGPVKDTGPVLFLSLFLLLLAFFILLNALATRDDLRVRAVIDSLVLTFKPPDQEQISVEAFVSALEQTPTAEQLIQEMERLWVGTIPMTKVEQLRPGRLMQFVVPVHEVFVGRSANIRADRRQLLVRIAKTLGLKAEGRVNELQFVVDDGTGELGNRKLQTERVSGIVREFVSHGAPAQTVTAGLQSGLNRSVRVRFFVRDEARAYLDFKPLANEP